MPLQHSIPVMYEASSHEYIGALDIIVVILDPLPNIALK